MRMSFKGSDPEEKKKIAREYRGSLTIKEVSNG